MRRAGNEALEWIGDNPGTFIKLTISRAMHWWFGPSYNPPVAVIVMTAPILLPLITQAGFDPYWFAVILTINMEIGLITPPVGLNLYVINGIAPDVGLPKILAGALPFVLLMILGILLLCIFPQIVTWLPDLLMGSGT